MQTINIRIVLTMQTTMEKQRTIKISLIKKNKRDEKPHRVSMKEMNRSSSSVWFSGVAKGCQRKIPCCHTLEEGALRSTTLTPSLCLAPGASNKITYFSNMTRTTLLRERRDGDGFFYWTSGYTRATCTYLNNSYI